MLYEVITLTHHDQEGHTLKKKAGPALAATGLLRLRYGRILFLAFRQGGLAAQTDTAPVVDINHLDLDHIAFLDDIRVV